MIPDNMKTAIDNYEGGLRLYKLRAVDVAELLELGNMARKAIGLDKLSPQEFATRLERKA